MANAIEARDIGKKYRIGEHLVGQYGRLTESLSRVVAFPLRRLRGDDSPAPLDEIWAVRHIDLDVTEGEAIGVVGRNGAGKTTLLKLFSRITEPTEGEASCAEGSVPCSRWEPDSTLSSQGGRTFS